MADTILREAENVVEIVGVLAEKRLEEVVDSNGVRVIRGELDIQTAENEVHTVRVYVSEKKKDGSESPAFKGFKTVMEEYKSIASHGKEAADKVEITSGRLGVNEYWGQDGQLKSYPQITTYFINRVKSQEKFTPKAEVTVEAFIMSITPEYDKNGEETGRLLVKTVIPVYEGKVIPFTFIAPVENGIAEHIGNNWEAGGTVTINADIINRVETKEVEQKVSFGRAKVKTITNTIREYVIVGGLDPYEEDNPKAYSRELIKKALAEREIYLEGLKNKKNDAQTKTEERSGFGSMTSSGKQTSQKSVFNPDDLPF